VAHNVIATHVAVNRTSHYIHSKTTKQA